MMSSFFDNNGLKNMLHLFKNYEIFFSERPSALQQMPHGNDEKLTLAYPAIRLKQPPEGSARFVALRRAAANKS